MKLSMPRVRGLGLVLAGATVVLAACGGGSSGSSGAVNGGTLIYGIDTDPTTLNPFEAGDVVSVRAFSFMFPNLFQADKNLNIVPDLASGMPTVSSDGLTWTVKLRQDAKWSDGTPITADDVVTTYQIEANANLDTDASFDWSPLTDPVTGIQKVDTYTVKFTLSKPFAPFLAVNLTGFIAPKEVYGKIDPAKMRTDPTNQTPTVTGGPFAFDKRVTGQEIDLKASTDYYGAQATLMKSIGADTALAATGGRPHFDKVILKVVTSTTAMANGLITGDLSMTPELNGDAIDAAKKGNGVQVFEYPDLAYYDVRFNDRAKVLGPDGKPSSTNGLFSDPLVRQAWTYIQDHDGMIKAATAGHGTPLGADVPPASWAYDKNAAPPYPKQDLTKAQSLLTQAGWTKGSDGILQKNGQKFQADFCVRSDKPQRVQAVTIMSDAASKVGMQLTPKPIDFKVFYHSKSSGGCGIFTGEFQLALAGWGLSLDPDDYTIFGCKFIRPEQSSTGSNYTGLCDQQLDAGMLKARSETGTSTADVQAKRKADYSAVQKRLRDLNIVYFLWSDNVGQGFVSKVAGIVAGGSGNDLNYADQDRNVQVFSQWYFKGGK